MDGILYKALYNTLSIFSCLKKSFSLMRVVYLADWKNGPSNDADVQDNGKRVGAIKYERRINPLPHYTGAGGYKSGQFEL